jgi:phage-related protein
MYSVNFYKEKNGRQPIREFLDSSNQSLRPKIIRQLKYLEKYGLTHENPNLKKLTGTPLWEVRILGKDSVRIICVAVIDGLIVVLHIFKKKSNKTSPKDFNLAFKRYQALDK